MRTISLILALGSVACAPYAVHPKHREIPDEVAPYVAKFDMYSIAYGSYANTQDLIIRFTDRILGEDGECNWFSNNTPIVYLNQTYWATASDPYRERLIAHELGHCLLDRQHRDIPESFMTTTVPLVLGNFDTYWDELFHPAKY